MAGTIKKVVVWGLGLMLLSVAGVAVFLTVAGDDFYRWAADRVLEDAIDRRVEIDGSFSLDLGMEPTLVVTDLWIGNATWAKKTEMMRVKRLDIQVALKPLFSGIVRLPRLVVEGLTLDLERGPDGTGNWDVVSPGDEDETVREDLFYPLLEFISLKDVAITYRDRQSGRDTEVLLRSLTKDQLAGDTSFTIQGEGRLNQSAFRITGRLGSIEEALSATAPYPIELKLDASGLVTELKGTAQNFPTGEGFDMTLTARAPSIGQVLETWKSELVLDGRAETSARLKGDLESLAVEDFILAVFEQSGQKIHAEGSLANLLKGQGLDLQFSGELGPQALGQTHGLPQELGDILDDVARLDVAGRVKGDLKAPAFEKLDVQLKHRSGADFSFQGDVSLGLSGGGLALTGLETTSILSLPGPALLEQALGTKLPDLGAIKATFELSWKEDWITLSSFKAEAKAFGGLQWSADGRIGRFLKGKLDLDPQLSLSASSERSEPFVSMFLGHPKEVRPPSKGSDGDLILMVQKRLNSLGLHPGPADGKMGPHTRAAIETYQAKNGLTVDGQATEELLRQLQPNAGNERPPVAPEADHIQLQNANIEEGFPELGPIVTSGRLSGRDGTYRLDNLHFTIGTKTAFWFEASGAVETLRPDQEHPLEGLTLKVAFDLPSSKAFARLMPPEVPELQKITGRFDLGGSPEALSISMARVEAEAPGGLAGVATGQVGTLAFVPSFATKDLSVELELQSPNTASLSQLFGFHVPELGAMQAKAALKDRDDLLAVTGIDASVGLAKKPAIRVTGEIGDLLALKQVAVNGNFEMSVASLLGLKIPTGKASLGAIRGQFDASDADGSMGLEKLHAKAINTDLFSLSIEGAFDDLMHRDELKFQTSLEVPDPSTLGRQIGFDVGKLEALSYTGHVSGSDGEFRSDGKAQIGQTEFSGTLSGSIKNARPIITAKLTSPVFHLADFGLVPEADSAKVDREIKSTEQRLFRSDPIPFEILRDFDLDLHLLLDQLEGVDLNIDKAEAQLNLKDGLLKIEPLRFHFEGGSAVVHLVADAHAQNPEIGLRLEADDVDLGDLLGQVEVDVPVDGELDMVLDLKAVGASPRALTSSLEGTWDMAISRGQVRTSLLDLAAMDIVHWMTSDSTRKGYSDLNCFILRADYHEGLGKIERLLLDTTNVLAPGRGDINLREETIDIKVDPHAKKSRFIELTTPFSIEGPLASPSVKTQGATARMIGEIVLTLPHLLGPLLPFVNDRGKDLKNPCLLLQAGKAAG